VCKRGCRGGPGRIIWKNFGVGYVGRAGLWAAVKTPRIPGGVSKAIAAWRVEGDRRPAIPPAYRHIGHSALLAGMWAGRRQGRLGELSAQFTARGAVHPIQAMLNFAAAIMTGRLTRVIVAMGLDPCFGFLHDGRKPGRLSLVWDCVEPMRPKLVNAVFEYVAAHEFERRNFHVFVHKITLERTVSACRSARQGNR
jgi:hypothetical protein